MIGFKEILWDSGGVWLLILAMTLAFTFNQLKIIMDARKSNK
jgi:hypothetical protein